jgi:hypothetical protein
MMLKMNFNFKIKDSPLAPRQSIHRLTTACDQDHMVEMTG